MTRVLESVLASRRLLLTVVVLLAVAGIASWTSMVRQEDPTMPPYWGLVVVPFPGADAETVERLVVDPLEEHLAEVDDLGLIETTARADVASLELELRGDTEDFQAAWDEVRRAVADARPQFPAGAGEPAVRDDLRDQESVVVAVTGDPDPVILAAAAERLKDDLLALDAVSRVTVIGDPGEQVTVELDDAAARRLGIDPMALAASLAERNRILPGGSLEVGDKRLLLRPDSWFRSVEEIAETPVVLPSGAAVPLGEVAAVRHGPAEPAVTRLRHDGDAAVGLGVVARRGIDVVGFGETVRERLAEVAPAYAPLELREVIYQPARVRARIADLGRSLLLGVLIVAGVLMAAMGPRLGLVVTTVLPLVTFSSLALFALAGGVLHQMSIAALVIALGMLVDNAIVVAENVQWRLDRGVSPAVAAPAAVRSLAVPLAAATGTTLAAFVPMLASQGTTAEFTRSIPVVIMLTLTMSYVYAVTVTPLLSQMLLRRRRRDGGNRFKPLARRLGRLAVGRPVLVLVAALVLVGGSFVAAGSVRFQFFPSSDRNQLMVELEMPAGTHLETIDAAAARLERVLEGRAAVTSVLTTLGGSGPKFYYNLPTIPQSPNYAQLAVETRGNESVDGEIDWLRAWLAREMPEVEASVGRLEQGPPVEAPIEVRLFGDDLGDLEEAAEAVVAELRAIPGAVDVRDDLGVGAPGVRFRIDDAAAGRLGLERSAVARTLFGRTRGLPAGELRSGDDPVPVVVRSAAGEELETARLTDLLVTPPASATSSASASPVPLAQVAHLSMEWTPATVERRNGRRLVTVSSRLAPGVAYSDVLDALVPRLEAGELPAGVTWALGGEAEGSDQANTAILAVLPLGVLLLVGILLAEFNSFRRVAIVFATVPLAAAGVVPGLLLGGQPFGFMSMLGIVALVGIVVNNAIVLLDVVEERRGAGTSIPRALLEAVERRTRPILLTTVTTVAGLLPLALSSSSLWPPMASAMISGLIASTLLTLVVVPALYMVLFTPRRSLGGAAPEPSPAAAAGLALLPTLFLAAFLAALLAFGVSAVPARAAAAEPMESVEQVERVRPVSFDQALELALDRPGATAAYSRAEAGGEDVRAELRESLLPRVDVTAAATRWDDEQILETPVGDFVFGPRSAEVASVTVSQPLLDLRRWRHGVPASILEARAAGFEAARVGDRAVAGAAAAYLEIRAIDATAEATRAFVASLEGRLEEIEARVEAGRALAADALKVRLAVEDARLDLVRLAAQRRAARTVFGQTLGTDEPLEPAAEPLPSVEAPASREVAVARALERRPELAAYRLRQEAAEHDIEAVKAELVPRLEARASWSWISDTPFADPDRLEGTVALVWTPFDGGGRAPRRRAAELRRLAADSELEEARRQVVVEVDEALAALETATAALEVGETAVEQAEETLRVERMRHDAGRTTTYDLLEAEAELRRQVTRRELARIDRVRAWVALELASGRLGGE